ncbi:MAG: cadherin repeat domain-containing protein [Ekhidna sp.]|nr:cadherin repeat domain-containing protein [Ekhidna sp.]MBC6409233.1 cadherin repeat domain-containing protein [Ekhidna sp.]
MVADQTFSVKEDAANRTAVGTVQATDAEDEYLTFSITSGNTGNAFAIAEGTGAITVAGTLDFETFPSYTLEVSVSDGKLSSNADITVNITDVEEGGKRVPEKDIELDVALGHEKLRGLWSDGMTMWVLDVDKIYAYKLADGTRDANKDIDFESGTHLDIWSDKTTMWVLELSNRKLFAYKLADRTRDAEKDISIPRVVENRQVLPPYSFWSDGTTIWILNLIINISEDKAIDGKIYAYTLADGTRDMEKDIETLLQPPAMKFPFSIYPGSIWSDGTTMWVLVLDDDKIYAYKLADGMRDAAREFPLDATTGNNKNPRSLWSDGTTMWVGDSGMYDEETKQFTKAPKIYAYSLPK